MDLEARKGALSGPVFVFPPPRKEEPAEEVPWELPDIPALLLKANRKLDRLLEHLDGGFVKTEMLHEQLQLVTIN